MAKVKTLTICNLSRDGWCLLERAGSKVETTGKLNGKLCRGTVCEDFEYKWICGAFPIEQVI